VCQQAANAGVEPGQQGGVDAEFTDAGRELTLIDGRCGLVGDGGQQRVRHGRAPAAQGRESVEEIVPSLVGLGAAQRQQEARAGTRWQHRLLRVLAPLGWGQAVGQARERRGRHRVVAGKVLSHVPGDGDHAAVMCGNVVQAGPLELDPGPVAGIV